MKIIMEPDQTTAVNFTLQSETEEESWSLYVMYTTLSQGRIDNTMPQGFRGMCGVGDPRQKHNKGLLNKFSFSLDLNANGRR